MRYLPAHAQHIGSRRYQQDSFGFADPDDDDFLTHGGFLAVLCDGMGGMEHGDVASETAVRAMLDAYSRKTPEESIPAALERSAREANRRVIQAALKLGLREGVGTTLVASVTHGQSLYFISVGDSAVFHVHAGEARMVNRPHVFANLLDEASALGKISSEEAERHPEREALTSYIGLRDLEEIDQNRDSLPLAEGDSILLASDGMFKTLAETEIAACLTGPPKSWPQGLVERTLALRRPGQDNVTVVSIAPDFGVADEWAPAASKNPTNVSPADNSPVTERATETPANQGWLIAVIFLLLVAIGVGGYWYFSSN
jgi:PPM family protein phosphatase